jgi:hypothetical protein
VGPLYFGWILSELTSSKASFTRAVETGFTLVWAAAHWSYQYWQQPGSSPRLGLTALFAVNIVVTLLVFVVGITALISGLRRKYPRYCSFLGHSRFASYLMITIFPIQSNYLAWNWDRLLAIVLFAVPLWCVIHMAFATFRK